jgi:hypothetical protein
MRPLFEEQFLDDVPYNSAFDRTEVFLGLLSEDQEAIRTSQDPNRIPRPRSKWLGRSTWRAANEVGSPVEEIIEETRRNGSRWAPLEAGLFGGDEMRADTALEQYASLFQQVASNRFLKIRQLDDKSIVLKRRALTYDCKRSNWANSP